jgi:hypothetical protein
LRKISEETFAGRIVLFRKQSDIVANVDKAFQDFFRFAGLAHKRQGVRQPEAASKEEAFSVGQAIHLRIRQVSSNESVVYKRPLDEF